MKLLLFLSLSLSVLAQARVVGDKGIRGEWGSGGGNALVCFNSEQSVSTVKQNDHIVPDNILKDINFIEVYDLYEAKKKRGFSSVKPEIITIGKNEDFYAYFDRLGMRYNNKVPLMSWHIKSGKELIPDTNIIFNESGVVYQNDLGSVSLPSSKCLITTMAAQVNFNNHFEVHIDQRLFQHKLHSKQSQATLILHELIYGIGRKYYMHKDSGSTRNLIRQYISYHPAINIGTVSKSLYDLNFRPGEYEDEETYILRKQYGNTNVMMFYEQSMKYFLQSFRSFLEMSYFWNNPGSEEFYAEVKKELKLLTDEIPNTAPFISVFDLNKMIGKGLELTQNSCKWVQFEQKFLAGLKDFKENALKELEEEKLSHVLDPILNNDHLTKTQKIQLMAYAKDWIFNHKSRLEMAEDLDEIYKYFFIDMKPNTFMFYLFAYIFPLTESSCAQIPDTNECAGIVKLDNIIPKAYIQTP